MGRESLASASGRETTEWEGNEKRKDRKGKRRERKGKKAKRGIRYKRVG